MKFHILNASGGSFTNKDTGEAIDWGSVHVLGEKLENGNGFTGQRVNKLKSTRDVFQSLVNKLPALFECEIELTSKNELRVISAAIAK
jgi:hypothetical protein